MVFSLMDESWTDNTHIFVPNISSRFDCQLFFKQELTRFHLCVSQVEASWPPSLWGFSPWSRWLSSGSASECSAFFVFTCREGDSLWLTPMWTWENLSKNVWIVQFFTSGICLWKKIDAEVTRKTKQIGNGQSHPLFIHKKPVCRSVRGVLSTF